VRVRFNAVAPEATEHFDEWLSANSGQLAYRPHINVTFLALADFQDWLSHCARLSAKPVGTMKICPVILRLVRKRRDLPIKLSELLRKQRPSRIMLGDAALAPDR
jgi:hypothetical protein